MEPIDQEIKGAELSSCEKYRYALWRIWDPKKPLVMFIGLNPSRADADIDDPTIRRVRQFSKDWNYGGFYMTNLFAYRTSHPHELQSCADPLGNNDGWLEVISLVCSKIVFAWGNFKFAEQRSKEVMAMFPHAEALVVNKNGTPRHPLYVKGGTLPKRFFLLLAFFVMCLLSCSKEPHPSDEVLITSAHECSFSIRFTNEAGRSFTDQYDCEYQKILPIHLHQGNYAILADNGFGRKLNVHFFKTPYQQALEFDW